MKKFLYAYRKLKGGFYTEPVVSPFDHEKIVELSQRAFLMNKGSQEHIEQKECDLYAFGTFDDVTGEFDLLVKPLYLCSFADVEEVKSDE